METQEADIAAWLLLSLLTGTLLFSLFMLLVIRSIRQRMSLLCGSRPPRRPRPALGGAGGGSTHFLDRLQGWVAVRSSSPEAVRDALGLESSAYCSWAEESGGPSPECRLFITPPAGEWILVFGPRLPTPDEDIDRCFRFLSHLSLGLGEAQYFYSDTATFQHAWARMVDGRVVRAYAWYGKTLWNQGRRTDAECKTRVRTYAYEEAPPATALGMQDVYRRNAEQVFALAGRWSINPRQISLSLSLSPGLSGDLSFLRPY